VNQCEEYEVEAVLDERKRGRQVQYLVRWKDYGLEDNTLEPEGNLANALGAIFDFKDQGQSSASVGYCITSVTSDTASSSPQSSMEGVASTCILGILRISVSTITSHLASALTTDANHLTSAPTTDASYFRSVPGQVTAMDLCQRILVCVCWRKGISTDVMPKVMREMEHCLHSQGLSIYIDLA
jgi:hypothetical protein